MKILWTVLLLGSLHAQSAQQMVMVAEKISAGTVATPTDSPGAGTYGSTQSVTLSDSTSGATICYTIDGSTPGAATAGTCDSSPTTTYSTAISVSSTTTIKAIGTKSGMTNSGVLTSLYTISGGSPSILSETCSSVTATGGVNYIAPSFTATAGAALWVTVTNGNADAGGTAWSSANGVAVGGGGGTDTLTQQTFTSQAFQTVYGYTAFNIHGGTYTITFVTAGSPSTNVNMCITQVTNVTSVAFTCLGTTATGTLACTTPATITPSASPAVVIAGGGAYYQANTYSAGAPYTIGATSTPGVNGNAGSAASLHYVCASSCTSPALTPQFTMTGTSGSNSNGIVAGILQ